jgi:TonB-dependent receptor-like protein
MQGLPSRFDFLVLDPPSAQSRGWRHDLFGWFVQDDYRLRPNLTLNLGLRHEFITAPNEVNGRSGNLRNITDAANVQGPPFQPAKLNFSPRIGLAWDPTGSGKTSVRAGFGVLHNQILGRIWYLASTVNADYLKSYTVRNPTFFPNAFLGGGSIGSLIPAGSLLSNWHMEYHQNTPTVLHYNFEIQRQLTTSLNARAGYVGSYGYNVTRWTDQNTVVPQILADGRKFFAPLAAALCTPAAAVNTVGCTRNPKFSDMGVVVSDSTFNYNAMQLSLQKTMSGGLHFQASYTLSKTLSDADDTGSLPSFSIPGTSQDDNNLKGDYSLSAYDQRHTLILNGVYQLVPLDKMLTNGVAKAILGGWAINGVYSYNTGTPVDILVSFNNSRNGSRFNPDRPDLAPGANSNPVHGVTAGCDGIIPAGEKLQTADRWYDPCAFSLPAAGFFGNLGRNTVTGPGTSNFDFTLVKNTKVTETKSLELRAEFFNLFNHANFLFPSLNVFNSSRARSGNAGRISDTTTANRQIQLGLKFIF